jgi:hypothetical protein
MATLMVQAPQTIQNFNPPSAQGDLPAPLISDAVNVQQECHDVKTTLNFFKDNEDGSAPRPTYVDKPETYERPFEKHSVTITDIRGDEDKYTLDSHGFQIVSHISEEKDFLDDKLIKEGYYKEVDELLKEV